MYDVVKIWKQKTFIVAIGLFILGVVFAIHANLTTYMDSEGYLHESLSTPLSVLCLLLGIGLLVISCIQVVCLKPKR